MPVWSNFRAYASLIGCSNSNVRPICQFESSTSDLRVARAGVSCSAVTDGDGWLSGGVAGLGWLVAAMTGVAVDWTNAAVGVDSGGRADAMPGVQPAKPASIIPAARRIILRMNGFMVHILSNHYPEVVVSK